MASVNGVSGGNSLYGTRNVFSGIASGMDTESMIENSIAGYRMRVSALQQQNTRLQWQQDAYRGLTNSLVSLSRKYTSYTSSTNLLSASFFNNSVITTANGANAGKVSATGKSNSDIVLNGVAQLASKTRYEVRNGDGGILDNIGGNIIAGSGIDLAASVPSTNVSGSLTLTYASKQVTISFGADEICDDIIDFAAAIERKLAEQNITFDGNSPTTETADNCIGVRIDNDSIVFYDKLTNDTQKVYINYVSGKLGKALGNPTYSSDDEINTLDFDGVLFKHDVPTIELIEGKSMSFTLDGVTKSITLPKASEIASHGGIFSDAFTALVQEQLDKAFGTDKIKVSNLASNASDPRKLEWNFKVDSGSTLLISSDINNVLGLDSNASNYLNTSKTLSELLGTGMGGLIKEPIMGIGTATLQDDGFTYKDSAGNRVNASNQRVDENGTVLQGYKLEINGAVIGYYQEDTKLETVMLDINNNTEAGVTLSYSKLTNQFVFTASDSGSGRDIRIGADLAEKLFGVDRAGTFTKGTDAIVNVSINGVNTELVRSSNTFDLDGLSVTLNGTFNGSMTGNTPSWEKVNGAFENTVTFTTVSDSDKIVDAIMSFVDDFNQIMTDLRAAYSTLPAQKSDGSKYMPLTESDLANMTESAIKNYEEQAKQGLLFGDQDLSALYNRLLDGITPGGQDGAILRSIGITTDYSQGLTTLFVDEQTLRDMLSTNPDTVRDAFSKVAGEGSDTNGLMQNLKGTLDAYSSVEGTKGILIDKAGSVHSANSLYENTIKKQMDELESQIERWNEKISTKVDYYTRQFTKLETLVARMNAQSESLAALMQNTVWGPSSN